VNTGSNKINNNKIIPNKTTAFKLSNNPDLFLIKS